MTESNDGEMHVERQEWSQGEFVAIHDPDMAENPVAVLPASDAEKIAIEILGGDLRGLIRGWREEAIEYEDTSASGMYRSEVRQILARELEELVEQYG